MQDSPLDKIVVGAFLMIVGLLIIILHRPIKEWRDSRGSYRYGEMWTGKYTRGGLIITYAVIILVGVVFLGLGISQIPSVQK
jgi:cytochrome bd-type quinol oxidase subunit 2